MNWNEISEQTDVNTANSLLESKITEIIESEAPMATVQIRTKYNKYLTNETKTLMIDRDKNREIARRTQETQDWERFKTLRNRCTKEQRKDKTDYLKKQFRKVEDENDTKNLFKMTRNLLGWNSSPLLPCLKKMEKHSGNNWISQTCR